MIGALPNRPAMRVKVKVIRNNIVEIFNKPTSLASR
jgi:hypothetical protein